VLQIVFSSTVESGSGTIYSPSGSVLGKVSDPDPNPLDPDHIQQSFSNKKLFILNLVF